MKVVCLLVACVVNIINTSPVRRHLEGRHVYVRVADDVSRKRHLANEHPDALPLKLRLVEEINGGSEEQLAGFLLGRNRRVEQGYRLSTDDEQLNARPRADLSHIAHYQDANGAIFAVKRASDGTHSYEGSFNLGAERFRIESAPASTRRSLRSADGEVPHIITRVPMAYAGPDDVEFEVGETRLIDTGAMPDVSEDASSSGTANKRSMLQYHIEFLIYVDYSEYKAWLDDTGSSSAALAAIDSKFSYIYNGMDYIYKNINSDYSVNIWLKEVQVNTNPANSPALQFDSSVSANDDPRTKQMHSENLLNFFKDKSSVAGSFSIPQDLDHVMYWIRFDLLGKSGGSGTVGLAFIDSICKKNYAYSVIEDTGFESWRSSSHELAHNIGSPHDGTGSSSSCSGSGKHVMASLNELPDVSQYGAKGFTFSQCSLDIMRQKLKEASCVSNPGYNGFNKVPVTLPGVTYDNDAQCKLTYFSGSEGCSTMKAERCWKGLPCRKTNGKCALNGAIRPADGTACGSNGMCMQGLCV